MSRARALDQLCRTLRHAPPGAPNWRAILEVANVALITPRLDVCLDDAGAPAEVRRFVSEVVRRNWLRNEGLYIQLGEAAVVLNRVGITPLVLKGAACLVRFGVRCPRMISDIDLVVAPEQVDRALAALEVAGFEIMERHDPQHHAAAVLAKSHHPGQLDLHRRPPGQAIAADDPRLLSDSTVVDVQDGHVRIPEPHMHIYLQALHDQLHDGGYWRGGFDLRHAWDIADLLNGAEVVDWERLEQLAPTWLAARAVAVQLQTCQRLTGADLPYMARNWAVRLHARRQRVQYELPATRIPLAAFAVLVTGCRLLHHRQSMRHLQVNLGLAGGTSSYLRSFKRLSEMLRAEIGGRL